MNGTMNLCRECAKGEFPDALPSDQEHVADRAQILFIRMWRNR